MMRKIKNEFKLNKIKKKKLTFVFVVSFKNVLF